ncbi:UNVERIFIED_ORG: poly(3-hydroxyalkanoate) synthetase [Pseudomonas vranovensis]|nr:poly(3-hydroxyalkanoate) synthetase [Pseudomonas vranovensis]
MTNSEMPASALDWQENSTKHTDSWWLYWQTWLAERSGKLKKAPANLGNKAYVAGAAAPGTYVHER